MMAIGDATYHLVTAQVRQRVVAFVAGAFAGLGSWRDEDVERLVNAVVPVVAGGQQRIASLTNAYLADQLTALFGVGTAVGDITADAVSGAEVRNGADPSDVYRRPFVEVYTALKEGVPLAQAVQRGVTRVSQLASADLQLSKTHAARATLRGSEARYFRRTLSGMENCGLCVIASTQRYRSESLMPIHPGCDCGVRPLPGNASPVIDSALLDQAHDAIALTEGTDDRSGRAPDYRKLIVTREHGEMGPLLAIRRQDFTGPADIH